MSRTHLFSIAMIIAAGVLSASVPAVARAQSQIALGTASEFVVLGGSTVTNTNPTTLFGSLGLSPGPSITGFPPGLVVGGTTHVADAVALQAQNDVIPVYNSLAASPCTSDMTGQDLGGLTLTRGTYCFSSSAQLTGTLTLNAENNPNAVFIFQVGSTLTTASNASVRIINGGLECNVFWQIGSSATLGTGTRFIGNVIALTSITVTSMTTVAGRALARNGAVTLDNNTITTPQCTAIIDAGVIDAGAQGGPTDAGGIDSGAQGSAADARVMDAGAQGGAPDAHDVAACDGGAHTIMDAMAPDAHHEYPDAHHEYPDAHHELSDAGLCDDASIDGGEVVCASEGECELRSSSSPKDHLSWTPLAGNSVLEAQSTNAGSHPAPRSVDDQPNAATHGCTTTNVQADGLSMVLLAIGLLILRRKGNRG